MNSTRCLDPQDFLVAADERYFEDYRVGDVHHYGRIAMTVGDIVDFGRRFDPQDMHTDLHAAEQGPTGGLIASGMHTASLCVRLLVDHYLSRVATLPSPGIRDLTFQTPVRPGDQLTLRTETIDSRLSRSKPTLGVVTTRATMLTRDDSRVAVMTFVHLIRRRVQRES